MVCLPSRIRIKVYGFALGLALLGHLVAMAALAGESLEQKVIRGLDQGISAIDPENYASAVAHLYGPSAIPILIRELKNQKPGRARMAVMALGCLGPKAAEAAPNLAALINARNNPEEEDLAQKAIEALGTIGPKADVAAPALIQFLDDPAADGFLQYYAAASLGAVAPDNPRTIDKLIEIATNDHAASYSAVDTLGEIGPKAVRAVPVLINILTTTDPQDAHHTNRVMFTNTSETNHDYYVHRIVAEALGKIGPAARESVPVLTPLLRHPNQKLREAALTALGKIGPAARGAVPEMLAIAKSGKPVPESKNGDDIRGQVIQTLPLVAPQDPEVIKFIVDSLRKRVDLQWATIDAIRQLGPSAKAAIPDLITILEDERNKVYKALPAWALGAMGAEGHAAAPALLKMLNDEKLPYNEREAASSALLKISPLGKWAEPELLKAAKTEKIGETAINIALTLDLMNPEGPNGSAHLMDLYFNHAGDNGEYHRILDWCGNHRDEARRIVPFLIRVMETDELPWFRANAASILGSFGTLAKDALPAMRNRLAGERDEKARTAIHKAIDAIEAGDASKAPY